MSRASWVRALFASVIGGLIGVGLNVGWSQVALVLAVAVTGYVVAWGLPE